MRIILRKHGTEHYIAIMFCLVFAINIIVFTFNNLMRLAVGNTYYLDSILIYTCYVLLLIHVLPACINAMNLRYMLFLLIVLAMPLLMCRNSDVTQKIVSQILPFGVLAFIFGVTVSDFEQTWAQAYKFSWIVLALAVVDTYLIKTFDSTSHMLGYAALFPSCVLVIEAINSSKNRLVNTLGLITSMVLIIEADTAGALAAIALTSIVSLLYIIKRFKKVAFLIIISLLGVGAILINNVSFVAQQLSTRLGILNVNVSLLDEIAGTGLTTDRYRNSIYEYSWKYAKEHLFIGSGVGNDRVLITSQTLVRNQSLTGNYPHNIFLEFMFQFGLVLGTMLSIFLVVFLIRFFVIEKNKKAQKIATLLMGMGFFPLLYSSSYIENVYFYLLIGFAWKQLRQYRMEKIHGVNKYYQLE